MGTMPPKTVLIGRNPLLAEIRALLRQRRSMLLVGPQEIGKTAIIGALGRPSLGREERIEHLRYAPQREASGAPSSVPNAGRSHAAAAANIPLVGF